MALANHRKLIRTLISDFGAAYHQRQAELIAREIEAKQLDVGPWTPSTLSAIMENLARCFALGSVFDIAAHIQARDFLSQWLACKVSTKADAAPLKDHSEQRSVKAVSRPGRRAVARTRQV